MADDDYYEDDEAADFGPRSRPEPIAEQLASSARQHGAATAASGSVDPWSFGHGNPPYVEELEAARTGALQDSRIRRLRADEQATFGDAEARADAADLADERTEIQAQHDQMARFCTNAEEQMNLLAENESRRRRWRRRPGPRSRDGGAAPPEQPDDANLRRAAEEASAIRRAQWTGPFTMQLPGWLRWAILGGLIAVEVPVQLDIFQQFHSAGPLGQNLTYILALGVAAVMVMGPHLAGHWFRSRWENGAEQSLRWVPLVILVPWLFLVFILAQLRGQAINVPTQLEDGGPSVTPADHAGVSPLTLMMMFAAILFVSGMVGFLLGVAGEHPFVVAWNGADQERRRLAAQLGELTTPAVELDHVVGSIDERGRYRREQWAAEETRIRAAFDRASFAYLDGIATSSGDPGLTESVTDFAGRLAGHRSAEPNDPRTTRLDDHRPAPNRE